MRILIFKLLLIGMIIVSLTSCGHTPKINPEGPYWKENDTKPIPEPAYHEPGLLWTSTDRTLFDQTLELLDLDRSVRKIAGTPDQALNTNSFDEVPNSSWFTNRMGLPQTRLTSEEITAGANIVGGPDTTGPWQVFRPKIGGVTPGFWIEDPNGNRYIIKFDPKGYPDLSTGSTTMAGRFFHACGYNVPEEYIVYWRPEILRIREGATLTGPDGKKRSVTMEDIESILEHIEREPDGRIRSLASLLLPNVKGPYSLKGTRKNDPNDWCPHEHRRELRGLYVMASFVNHFDVKDFNSMDCYVGKPGEGFLKHYLLDFGSTFGSAGYGPMEPIFGYANLVDARDMGVSMLTLGLKKWQWEDAQPPTNRSVGYYEAEIFNPAKWDPVYPVPPFENMTAQDGYWGAKIVMAFRDEYLRVLIEAGQYRDEEAKAYLFETMKKRRDKIGRYWFDKVNPLDYPEVSWEGESGREHVTLSFENLAVNYELGTTTTTYLYEIKVDGQTAIGPENTNISSIEFDAPYTLDNGPSDIIEIRVRTLRNDSTLSKPAIFWLSRKPETGEFIVSGIEHP